MSKPFYRQIQEDLRARIAAGEWLPGSRLPPTHELVAFYQTKLRNPNLATETVRRGVSLLIESGELRGQQGLGVFVPDAPEDVD